MRGIPSRWALWIFAVALLLALSTCYAASYLYTTVMCPPNWKIIVAQRYDKRDKHGWIIERKWIARCL